MHFGQEVERRVAEELRRREAALDEREARFVAMGLEAAERPASALPETP